MSLVRTNTNKSDNLRGGGRKRLIPEKEKTYKPKERKKKKIMARNFHLKIKQIFQKLSVCKIQR